MAAAPSTPAVASQARPALGAARARRERRLRAEGRLIERLARATAAAASVAGPSGPVSRLARALRAYVEPGLQPKAGGEAGSVFWQGSYPTMNDEPQGNQALCQNNESISELVKAMSVGKGRGGISDKNTAPVQPCDHETDGVRYLVTGGSTMSFGTAEGDASDKYAAFMRPGRDEADGARYSVTGGSTVGFGTAEGGAFDKDNVHIDSGTAEGDAPDRDIALIQQCEVIEELADPPCPSKEHKDMRESGPTAGEEAKERHDRHRPAPSRGGEGPQSPLPPPRPHLALWATPREGDVHRGKGGSELRRGLWRGGDFINNYYPEGNLGDVVVAFNVRLESAEQEEDAKVQQLGAFAAEKQAALFAFESEMDEKERAMKASEAALSCSTRDVPDDAQMREDLRAQEEELRKLFAHGGQLSAQ